MSTAQFTKDFEGKRVVVERVFVAPREKVWHAWTVSEELDKWWGPKPWNAVTHSHSFSVGGRWRYYMAGPQGEKEWCGLTYTAIDVGNSFSGEDYFSDADGVPRADMPVMKWRVEFSDVPEGTKVVVTTDFASEADMRKITDMGFEQGFSQGLDQLATLVEG